MSDRFALTMAWREGRSSLRRFAVLMASVSVGVGALVAIDSFGANLQQSVRDQARALLGADLVLRSTRAFSPTAEGSLAGLLASVPGAEVARVTRFASMALVTRTPGTRFVQVTAVAGGFPFYGQIETDPEGLWPQLASGDWALVDPSLLIDLDARVGDTLALGSGRFLIRGTVPRFPGDVGVRASLGPRVFIPARRLQETHLLGFGARVQHEAYLRLPAGTDPERLADRLRATFAAERVTLRTVAESQESLRRTLDRFARYLGLVALVSVLLGGLGVASAVHVLIKRRTETIAILRCLGAESGNVLRIYLAQALAMAFVGSLLGVALGFGLQALLPHVLRGLVPVTVTLEPSWSAAAWGFLVGLWVAALFALLPLLSVRRIAPLAVLRRPYEEGTRVARDGARLLAALALAVSVVALASLQARSVWSGLAFAGSIALALGALGSAAIALRGGLRRLLPSRWPYVWRQGLANLYRPANQTVMVVLALGFGAFLLDTLFLVQHNLLRELRSQSPEERPNLALFDIQPDQREPIARRLGGAGLPELPAIPIVPMRIRSVKGEDAQNLLARPAPSRPEPGSPRLWTLRSEYRATYRDALSPTERTAGGSLWEPGAGRHLPPGAPVPVSLETEVARELGVTVGDEVVWDVQGVMLVTRVVHLREVTWARFEANFFVVFPEGPLDPAPQTFLTFTRMDDPVARVRLQRSLVEAFPNVSILDLSQVQQALDTIISRVAAAIRFMALFCLATGAVVLVGAVATSRYQRLREAVLLRALGASRLQILAIALVEYSTLGALSAVTGLALAVGAGWALARFAFDSPFALPAGPLLGLATGLLVLSVAVGLATSLEFLRRPPLEVLRAE